MKKRLVISFLLTCLFITSPLLKGKDGKFAFSFGIGYSLGLSNFYDTHVEGAVKSQTKLSYNWDTYIQYTFSRHLGVQMEMEFQKRTFHDVSVIPEWDYTADYDESFFNYSLNIILFFNNPQRNKFSFYLISGLGIMAGEGGAGAVVKIGGGLKYYLSKQGSLNLRLPFIYHESDFNLFDPSYISINIGLEYRF